MWAWGSYASSPWENYQPAVTMSVPNRYSSGYTGGGTQNPGMAGMPQAYGSGFTFRKRFERIDWKRLASVDVDAVARNMDFLTLQDNVMNLTFCNIESELDARAVDPNYIKLFKLAQLTIEYLLHSQEYLFNKMQELSAELDKEKEESSRTQTDVVGKLKVELSDLKKELQQRKKFIAMQQQIINSGNDAYYKCTYCSKAFINSTFLNAHVTRRHPEFAVQVSQAPPTLSAPPPAQDKELARELEEIRERLHLTESQLVEERNSRNDLAKRELSDKSWVESELHRQMESWKLEQLSEHRVEVDKVRKMFMQELHELNEKLRSSENALEELRNMRTQAPVLGTLRDDVDSEEVQRQRAEIVRLTQQLEQVEEDMQLRLVEQERVWKKKMDQNNNQLAKMNLAVEHRIKELERKRNEDDANRTTSLENRRRDQINKAAADAVRDAMRQHDKVTPPRPAAQYPREEVIPKVTAPAPPAAAPPVVESDESEEEVKEEEEEEVEEEEELEDEEVEEEEESAIVEHEQEPGMTLTLSGPDRLKAELKRNPRFLEQFRRNVEVEFEEELEYFDISRTCQGLDDRVHRRVSERLRNQRDERAKPHRRFYDLRNECINEVEKMARKRQPRLQVQTSVSTNGVRQQQPAAVKQNAPGKNSHRPHASPPSLHEPKPRRQVAEKSPRSGKAPKTTASSQPASSKPTPQPAAVQPSQQSVPRPAPRGSSPRGKTDSPSAKPPTYGQALDVRGSFPTAANSTVSESQWDSDESPRDKIPQVRPRVPTPPDQTRFNVAADVHTRDKPGNDDDGDDDWDEISDLQDLEPAVPVSSNATSSRPPQTGGVRDKAKNIELQLQDRQKKPFGGVDILAGAAGHSGQQAAVDDDSSLPSVSSDFDDDEEQSLPPKQRLAAPPRNATIASTVQTNSSNTYGSWDSSARDTAVSTINSKMQKSGKNIDDDDDFDHWDST